MHTSAPRRIVPGYPGMFYIVTDRPFYMDRILEWEIVPRDEYGVPAHIPPDLSTTIQHAYYLPPDYYPFLKKLGDDDSAIKPFCDKIINGQLTFADYEEMFYKSAKPIKIYRNRIPMPYRTEEEIKKTEEVVWEGKWLSFQQRVRSEYLTRYCFRDFMIALMLGLFTCQIWMSHVAVHAEDMKLFYLFAPENKINWVLPRGDL